MINTMQYELIIIGGGPAGVSAGVYAARKKINTLFLTFDFQSQSTVSTDIQNWIGTPSISGQDFAKNMEAHVRAYAGDSVQIQTGVKATDIQKITDADSEAKFIVTTDDGKSYETKTILIATGSTRRKIEAKNADIFEHKGLTYCASCDGPVFEGQDVAVLGGGNAAFETAAQLLAYCSSVTLINRGESFRADEVTVEKLSKNPKFKIIKNAEVTEIAGNKFVSGVVYKNTKTDTLENVAVTGVFVEIGLIPTTDYVKNVIELNSFGQIPVDAKTQQTKTPGIWAAGDCTDGIYHQNNIAAGDAVKALEDIYVTLHTK